ncbi:hypothetical protein HBA54_07530 [Pelagibius litoralis]|uniref:Uncharacterized protein n=1 Tax=Pelagibius litoralis TaxID=374515 RepID=A0A967C6J4_9PROT|nr:hypothetical protein [Pelagibius litoralis]NIA68441.1 hypothetical protein [Pelagibius litoralis]
MPLQNRVTPFSTIQAVDSRGLVMGNRGCLHGDERDLRSQRWRTKSWIVCRLAWKGVRRRLMKPGSWTELFFLDEAVALAAGHRPCGYCRRGDYRRFLDCWAAGTGWRPARPPRQPDVDARLHADRVDGQRRQRHHDAALDSLPDGCFVLLPDDPAPWLVQGAGLHPWSHAGYGPPVRRPRGITVRVVTPASTVAAIAAGYTPLVHPSAFP